MKVHKKDIVAIGDRADEFSQIALDAKNYEGQNYGVSYAIDTCRKPPWRVFRSLELSLQPAPRVSRATRCGDDRPPARRCDRDP